MKVLLVNGGPHKEGCTYTALSEVAATLQAAGVETEIVWLGVKPLAGCIGCGSCAEKKACFRDDVVNEFLDKAAEADGFVFGSPVHFASASGAITSFMDRAFYAGNRRGVFAGKPAAAIASCRRGGATATFDQLNKYFTISSMPVVSSQYWNMVHGNTPCMVIRPTRYAKTSKACRPCARWDATWRGSCAASRRDVRRASTFPAGRRSRCARTLSADVAEE